VLFHQMLYGVDIQPPSSRYSKRLGHQPGETRCPTCLRWRWRRTWRRPSRIARRGPGVVERGTAPAYSNLASGIPLRKPDESCRFSPTFKVNY
jgi:hypothetical protein